MNIFGPAAVFGLIFGFMFGMGCSLAIFYSIYLGGYRKGVEDSLLAKKPPRFLKALERVQARLQKTSSR